MEVVCFIVQLFVFCSVIHSSGLPALCVPPASPGCLCFVKTVFPFLRMGGSLWFPFPVDNPRSKKLSVFASDCPSLRVTVRLCEAIRESLIVSRHSPLPKQTAL